MPRVRKLSPVEITELERQAQLRSKDDDDVAQSRTAARSSPYPHIEWWVADRGWIEVGYNEYNQSFIRILDIGGMVWEGEYTYPSLDAALRAGDAALAELEAAGEL